MSTNAPGALQKPSLQRRVSAKIKARLDRPWYYRLRARYDARLPDVEVRQLRALREAYSGDNGPEVLVFGDSTMFWTRTGESDPRKLTQMVSDEFGSDRVHTIVGPGYNSRLVGAFVEVLDELKHRPQVIVVPMSLMMASVSWVRHPVMGAVIETDAIRAMIAAGEPYPDRLPRAQEEDWNAFDRTPAPSFTGAQQTLGEIRMITNAIPPTEIGLPTTNWQKLVRVRHLLSLSNAGRLDATSEGVVLAGNLSARLAESGQRSLAYIPPVNLEVVRKFWGEPAVEQVLANGALLENTYRENSRGLGAVLNSITLSPQQDFADPAHLNGTGRLHFARELVAALRAELAREV
ncbi:MAG: hypothetical protein JWQ32_439 [Marmoricola sp.]|nr:hypothetical protein [Marmoricola sp.]